MKRRKFIAGLGAAAWPVMARGQQVARTVGWLSPRSRATEEENYRLIPFRHGLGHTGYVEGKNLVIEYRWADGRYDQLQALASDLVRKQVEVIATTGGPQPARAAQLATSTIPIVFGSGSDPIKDGLVKSWNRPGGNTTGIHVFSTSLGPKRLELLRELVPGAHLIAFLVNSSSQIAEMQVKEVEEIARAVGQKMIVLTASTDDEIGPAFTTLVHHKANALLMSADTFFQVRRDQLVALAAHHGVPVMYEWPEFTRAGGLVSYSTVRDDTAFQQGMYVGRILNGAKPADLPIFQSTKFELVINLRTARALGLQIPPSLLARADEVIE